MKIPLLIFLTLFYVSGCGTDHNQLKSENHSHDHSEHHAHHHEPPHGGTVFRLGDELYHLEWVKDTEAGIMRCYVLDGHMENFVRIQQKAFEVSIPQADSDLLIWIFNAVENRATGEKVGDTSEFHASLSELTDQNKFEGKLLKVHIRGQEFENIDIKFPEGNETH